MQVLWLRFLTEIGETTKEAPAALIENPQTSQALGILEESAFNEAELYQYERFWDVISSQKTLFGDIRREAQKRIDAAIAERNAATAERDAATAERDAATERLRQTALNLKRMGLTVEQISAATGLSADEITSL